jgi:galactitol-specific phosphotransferase system IIB component
MNMYKFLKSQKGKISAGIAASALASFLFVLAKVEDIETKEKITHIMNATTMAEALGNMIVGDLILQGKTDTSKQTLGPSNTLSVTDIASLNNPNYAVTAGTGTDKVITATLEQLVNSKFLVEKEDPTHERVDGAASTYDASLSKAQVTCSTGTGQIDTVFLVNLGQNAYATNTPYTAAEHFFYVQGFASGETTDNINYTADLLGASTEITHQSVNMPSAQ